MRLKNFILAAIFAIVALSANAKGLSLKVYNPGTKAIFPVSSTIVYGKKAMTALYPNLPGKDELAFGAKVFKGEQAWKISTPYPPIGRAIKVDFGSFAFRNSFKDAHHMTFLGLNGIYKGLTDNVNPTVVEVSPNVFMVYWSEPNSTKSNVVHVQNYNTGTVWTNIAAPDGKFYNMQGKLSVVE